LFVPTLKLKSLAYRTPQNITNVNKFYFKKILLDIRNTNGYCTRVTNTPLCNTKISLTDKTYCDNSTVSPIISTRDEILVTQRCVDLTNNYTSDCIKYTKDSNKYQPFQARLEESINNLNISSVSNDEITKQPTPEKVVGCKKDSQQLHQITTKSGNIVNINSCKPNPKGGYQFCLSIVSSVLIMIGIYVAYVFGLFLFFLFVDYIVTEHPDLALLIVLFCLFSVFL
jgi:hypothetical protein